MTPLAFVISLPLFGMIATGPFAALGFALGLLGALVCPDRK